MHYIKNKNGFTLVELVVVATILAILSAVGFSAYTGYIAGARDTNRIAQLTSIHDGLNVYTAKGSLPLPDDSVNIEINGQRIAYQGYAGSNTLETIGYKKGGKDPKDDVYFSYYLDSKKNNFQLMAFLEETESQTTFHFGKSLHADTYIDRIPTLYGQELGILTDTDNTPVQELESIKTAGNLDVSTTSDTYKAHISETNIIIGSSSALIEINPNTGCERIKQVTGNSTSDYYTIDPLGFGNTYRIYCNMNDKIQNLITQKWTIGTGSDGNFSRAGGSNENSRELGGNHVGEQSILWKASPDGNASADGGWNYSDISISSNKTYRVSVWMKKTGDNNGTSYLGTLGNVINTNNGATNGNPYFWNGDLPELDRWFLIVGYIFPEDYTGTITKGGIYNTDSHEKVISTIRDFKFEPGVNVSRHRSFLFYNNANSTNRQYYFDPRFEEIPAGLAGDVKDLLPVKLN